MRRASCLLLLALCGTPVRGDDPEHAPPPVQIEWRSRAVSAGRLVGATADALEIVSPTGPAGSLHDVVALRRPIVPQSSVGAGPLRRIEFRNGDSLIAELLPAPPAGERPELRLRLLWGAETVVAWDAVARIGPPAGVRQVLWEDHDGPDSAWRGSRAEIETAPRDGTAGRALRISPTQADVEIPLAAGVAAGACQARFDAGGTWPDATWVCRLEFGEGEDARVLSLSLAGPDDVYEAAVSGPFTATRQRVARKPGWRTLRCEWSADRIVASIDDAVLLAGRGPVGTLRRIQLVRSELRQSAEPGVGWWDDLLIVRHAPPPAAQAVLDRPDAVLFGNGDRWSGEARDVEARGLTLQMLFGPQRVTWDDVVEVQRARQAYPEPPHDGWWAWLDWQPVRGPAAAEDRLLVAIQSAGARLDVWHPALGRLEIPWSAVRRLTPLFRGRRYALEPLPLHLGREVRPEFRRPAPDGTLVSRELTLAELPAGTAYVSADVAELEPSGPRTPSARGLLAQLRSGRLTTELVVNGRRVQAWNASISHPAPSARPERLRIRLPAGSLQRGVNQFQLRQQPSAADPRSFDDCEFSSWALEVE